MFVNSTYTNSMVKNRLCWSRMATMPLSTLPALACRLVSCLPPRTVRSTKFFHVLTQDVCNAPKVDKIFKCLSCRFLSSTRPTQTKTIKLNRIPTELIPPYPFGASRIYKQADRGLYGDSRIRFGNKVAEKYYNKSKRVWRPNLHVKTFYSPYLDARIKTRLTLRVLKTIRFEGGLDNYLLKNTSSRLKQLGPGGWKLRWLLMHTQLVQARFNKERVALGLKAKAIEDHDEIVQCFLDRATPGPLSLRSRRTLQGIAAATDDALHLGMIPREINLLP